MSAPPSVRLVLSGKTCVTPAGVTLDRCLNTATPPTAPSCSRSPHYEPQHSWRDYVSS